MTEIPKGHWQPGPMAGARSTRGMLQRVPAAALPSARAFRPPLVQDQGALRLSVAHAVWHWLAIHDRSWVGLAPEHIALMAHGPQHQIESYIGLLRQHEILKAAHYTDNPLMLARALDAGLGPVLVGSDWYAGMDAPDLGGVIRRTGRRRGRHAYLLVGTGETEAGIPAVRVLNSRGPTWGQLGRAWLPMSDLAELLAAGGYGCVPVATDPTLKIRRQRVDALIGGQRGR